MTGYIRKREKEKFFKSLKLGLEILRTQLLPTVHFPPKDKKIIK